ncbi:polysaccharide pyruvyl transferase family protein [Tranquillimonas alkanivorans]|uniref:Polysaccharide pyruvyl transferase n=1 Tax=Tranquillimonas alkanivorans TaxID=441119 RepID=A0A1I5L6P7_9RHOB|nr:polysaccharide pyruvyl transferase family protein [Tranquillimonas alkanivorans]SFO92927.1 Polysaccharide pyruvyl transferase [Tranquillimonas alkanivorans]
MTPVAVFNDTSFTDHYGCHAVMSALGRGLRARGMEPAYHWPVARDWRDAVPDVRALGVRALVVNGEGSIHHSETRERARWLAELPELARDLGVPAVLLNASISDLDAATLEKLGGYDLIYVRETQSRAYLVRHGIEAAFAPDLSFDTPAPVHAAPRRGLLVTDSVMKEARRDLRRLARREGGRFVRMIERPSPWRKLVARLRPGAPVPQGATLADAGKAESFAARLAGARLVVTGRFHSVTLALKTRTPVLAAESNTAKISALMTDVFGATGRVIGAAELASPNFAARVQEGAAFDTAEGEALDLYLIDARDRIAAMFDDVARLSGGTGR